jgi:hypothetical protein
VQRVNGTNGTDGTDASSMLVLVTRVGPGGDCPTGGVRVDGGRDADQDGVLDAGEVTTTATVCDGENGADGSDGVSTLSTSSIEPAGEACPSGGVRFDQGSDEDGDGVLDAGEVASSSYVCESDVTSVMSVETNEFIDYGHVPVLAQSASIAVPSAGRVVAIGVASLSWSNGVVGDNESAWAHLSLCHLEAISGACRGQTSVTFPLDVTVNYSPEYVLTSLATFDVVAGTHIFQLWAGMGEEDDAGTAGRRNLLLFFLPD